MEVQYSIITDPSTYYYYYNYLITMVSLKRDPKVK